MTIARLTRLLLVAFLAACASAPHDSAQPLRVLVYNIHAGRDATGKDNLERVAALITDQRADLVLLQEVDRGTTRSGKVDQLAELKRLTGLDGVFGKSLDYQGGEYGIAILSRWPIANERVIPLRVEPPQVRAGGSVEPRIALIAEIAAPGGTLRVLNTHLDASREETYRLQEVETIVAALAAEDSTPLLAGGDFNAEPQSNAYAHLRRANLQDAFQQCGKGEGLTYPAGAPVKRIDYLFLVRGTACTGAAVLDSAASDHLPLLVNVTSP